MRAATDRLPLVGLMLALAACAEAPLPAGAPAPAALPVAAASPPDGGAAISPPPAPPATAPAPQSAPGAGVRVYIDPATGEARAPTRAERAADASAGRVRVAGSVGQAASEGVQREHFVLPDGTEGVRLLPRDRHALLVCRQRDGSYGGNCPAEAGSAAP